MKEDRRELPRQMAAETPRRDAMRTMGLTGAALLGAMGMMRTGVA